MNCFIIAEAGINHDGNLFNAKSLALTAKKCGADAVKFQTWFRYWPDLKYLTFTKDQWKELFSYCDYLKMPWFSTPFDLEAIDFLKECGMKIWKVSSGMIANKIFLDHLARVAKNDRIIISTGMSREEETLGLLTSFSHADLLYCVSLYPPMPSEIDLTRIRDKWYFAGFSDHSPGYEMAIAAVTLGARIIEKHITRDRNLPGPDHKSSLDPQQFADMVRCIRNVEQALWPKPMSPRENEQKIRIRARMAF